MSPHPRPRLHPSLRGRMCGEGVVPSSERPRGWVRPQHGRIMAGMDDIVARLAEVEVLSPEGEAVRMGSLWEEKNVLLAMVRHFGCIFCKEQLAALKPY